LDDIAHRSENSSQKSLRRLPQQSGVVCSAWITTKLLHIHPYKITVVLEIKPVDYEKRERFCNWHITHMHDGFINPKLTFYKMRRLILIFQDVNSEQQVSECENPHALMQLPL
jgi:hypothetical protein